MCSLESFCNRTDGCKCGKKNSSLVCGAVSSCNCVTSLSSTTALADATQKLALTEQHQQQLKELFSSVENYLRNFSDSRLLHGDVTPNNVRLTEDLQVSLVCSLFFLSLLPLHLYHCKYSLTFTHSLTHLLHRLTLPTVCAVTLSWTLVGFWWNSAEIGNNCKPSFLGMVWHSPRPRSKCSNSMLFPWSCGCLGLGTASCCCSSCNCNVVGKDNKGTTNRVNVQQANQITHTRIHTPTQQKLLFFLQKKHLK